MNDFEFEKYKNEYAAPLYKYASQQIKEHFDAVACCDAAWEALKSKWNQIKCLAHKDIYAELVNECKKHICSYFKNKYIYKSGVVNNNIVIHDSDRICSDLHKKVISGDRIDSINVFMGTQEKPLPDIFNLYFLEGKDIDTVYGLLPSDRSETPEKNVRSYTQRQIHDSILLLRDYLKIHFGM